MESTINHLSQEMFLKIKKISLDYAGLSLKNTTKEKILYKVKKRMNELSITDFNTYCHYLQENEGELQEFINLITNLSTYFFRENHHFVYLAKHILPQLLAKKTKIRIWSAGCATGEEAYSIALTISETVPNFNNYDIKILATDINSVGLTIAKEGRYLASDLRRMEEKHKQNGFTLIKHEDLEYLQIKNSIKKLVYFNYLNLFDVWPMKGLFDVIFCRNTFIYFSKEKIDLLFNRFDNQLTPNGFLIVGHAESSFINKLKYKRVSETIYEKLGK